MNKEELNQEIGKLKASLEAHESQVKDLQHDLKVAEQRLVDADKPKLTEKSFELIHSAIETAVSNYRFDDADQFEYEFGIEYDNRVELSFIEFKDHDDLASEIYSGIESEFGLAEDEDEDDESSDE